MRQFCCLVFLVLLSTVPASAQTGLDSFYKQGTTWRGFSFFKNNFPSNSPAIYTAGGLTVEHDTILNGKTYHLMSGYSDGGYSIANSQVTYNYTTTPKTLSGAIRVDSQKVYLIAFGWPPPLSEKLIYDFALTAGDTMHDAGPGGAYKIVQAVDTVYLSNGIKLRKYVFMYASNTLEDYWIEGAGSRLGFLAPNSWMYPPTYSRALCYKSADGYEYKFPDSNLVGNLSNNCFAIPTSVAGVAPVGEEVTIFPNPVTDQFVTVQSIKGIVSLRLYDVTGKLCTELGNIKSNEVKLAVPENSGLYLLDMELAGGRNVKRKIYR